MAKTTDGEGLPKAAESYINDNVNSLGNAPAHAMAHTYNAMAHSTGIMFQNAVFMQQCVNVAALATTFEGVIKLLGRDTVECILAALKKDERELANLIAKLVAAADRPKQAEA